MKITEHCPSIPPNAWWLWSQPEDSDELIEPEVAGPSMHTLLEGLPAKREEDIGGVLASSRPGSNWDRCPNNSSGNASTSPPCPKVKGITIGSLFQGSKASLTLLSEARLQDAQHASPTPLSDIIPASLNWETTLPRAQGPVVWPSSFLPSTHSVSLVKLVIHSRFLRARYCRFAWQM